jgi:hypothetical protein
MFELKKKKGKLQKWSFTFYEIAKMGPRQKVAQKRHQRSEFSQNRHREAFSVSFPVKCHVHESSIVILLFILIKFAAIITSVLGINVIRPQWLNLQSKIKPLPP